MIRLLCGAWALLVLACSVSVAPAFAADNDDTTTPAPAGIGIDADGNVEIATDKEIRFSADKVVMSVSKTVEIEKRTP